jgi:Holliday junction resolvasome RuvABC endonuclease subunit
MNKIIMGVDPGTEHTGVAYSDNLGVCHVGTLGYKELFGIKKLWAMCEGILSMIHIHCPDFVVIEDYGMGKGFFNTDVSELVGMVRYSLFKSGKKCEVCFLAPNTIKKHLTGNGRAKKSEVMKSIKKLFPEVDIKASHEADALALLLTFKDYLAGNFEVEASKKIKNRTYKNA